MTGKTMPDRFYNLKSRSRKGCKIQSIRELMNEENVYYCKSFIPVEFLKTWKFGRVLSALETGGFSYAFPAEAEKIRFPDEDVIHIERRLEMPRTIESRAEIIRLLHNYDAGIGDADDVIDLYEDEYLEYVLQ